MSAEQPIQRDFCFVSYARADERFALRLAEDLRRRGIAIWIDQLNIRTSDHWDRAIEHAIRESSSVLVILSPRAVVSDNVADEITLAVDGAKTIIPVVIEACRLPLRLARMQLIDATSAYELALRQCLDAIKVAAMITPDAPATPPLNASDGAVLCATRQLATIVGPIAGILVESAARRATSIAALYGILSLHIHDHEDREQFLSSSPKRDDHAVARQPAHATPQDEGGISTADIQRVTKALTQYLGPIAPLITKRERVASRSLADLLVRVAATIRCEQDRSDFREQLKLQ
jgi:hypothetical protein